MDKPCEVDGCNNPVVAYGLCDKHRKRLSRHGHLKNTRPDDWGKREKHPLYNTWCWMKKMEAKYSVCDEWKDFWKFVEDVGERPSQQHQLRRIDKYGNYCPENCEWVEIRPDQDKAEYAREWRANNPDRVKHTDLRRKFGITLDDYSSMLEKQNGVCAICGNSEPYNGYSLAVDHDHGTGKVRGLLCSSCNRAIGLFKDSPELLQKAINYLKE